MLKHDSDAPQLLTLMVDGVALPRHNAEGHPIHETDAGIANFWRWFGGSQLVDDQGRPRVFYHGPTKGRDFEAFAGVTYFTDSEDYARHYLESDDPLPPIAVYLRVEHPVAIDAQTHALGADAEELANDPWWVAIQRKAGFDGLLCVDGQIQDVAIFDPGQAKAVENAGIFDPASDALTDGLAPPSWRPTEQQPAQELQEDCSP